MTRLGCNRCGWIDDQEATLDRETAHRKDCADPIFYAHAGGDADQPPSRVPWPPAAAAAEPPAVPRRRARPVDEPASE